MRGGAVNREAEHLARLNVRRAHAAADEGRASRIDPRAEAMSAPRPEFDYSTALRRLDDAGGLGRYQGLKIDRREQIGLDYLSFDQRRGHPQQRLARERHSPFGHRPHVAGEAEVAQVVEEFRRDMTEGWQPSQILDLAGRKTQAPQVI